MYNSRSASSRFTCSTASQKFVASANSSACPSGITASMSRLMAYCSGGSEKPRSSAALPYKVNSTGAFNFASREARILPALVTPQASSVARLPGHLPAQARQVLYNAEAVHAAAWHCQINRQSFATADGPGPREAPAGPAPQELAPPAPGSPGF